MENKYDASIPREMFWADEIPNSNLCPACQRKTKKDTEVSQATEKKDKKEKQKETVRDVFLLRRYVSQYVSQMF